MGGSVADTRSVLGLCHAAIILSYSLKTMASSSIDFRRFRSIHSKVRSITTALAPLSQSALATRA